MRDMSKMGVIDAIDTKTDIIVWCRDNDGELHKVTSPVNKYTYCHVRANGGDNHQYFDMFGNPLRKVNFKSKWDLREYRDSRSNLFESDVSPSYKMLLEEFSNSSVSSPINVCLYDIEVEVDLGLGKGYPTVNNPYGEINLIQVYDNYHNCYRVFTFLDDIEIEDEYESIAIVMVVCTDEADLLSQFASYLEPMDVISGWFSAGFDLPYIMRRAEIHFPAIFKTMFCRDGFDAKYRKFYDENGSEQHEWTLIGRQHIDMMVSYSKFIPGEKPSLSLDSVAEIDLGLRKVSYTGDLGELYRENPREYIRYGVHDVRLLKMLDKKHNIINICKTLARETCTLMKDTTGSVKVIEHGLMKYCRQFNIILPDKKENIRESFPGAIVYDTINGKWKWMFSSDLTGLYPSIIIMLGISPETFVFQLIDDQPEPEENQARSHKHTPIEGIIIQPKKKKKKKTTNTMMSPHGADSYVKVIQRSHELVNLQDVNTGITTQMKAYEVDDLIRETGCCLAASGAIFTGEAGILSRFVKTIFDTRNAHKKLMGEYARTGDDHNRALEDLLQRVYKILGNSIYGATGETSFRLFDIRLSKAVTLSGRIVSKWQAYKCNELVNALGGD